MADCPHFAFPFRFATGGPAVVLEQDSDEDLQACCAAILSYPIGSRPELPDFGVDEQAFQQGGPDLLEVRAAISAYEPRASAQIDLSDDFLRNAVAKVRVGVAAKDGG